MAKVPQRVRWALRVLDPGHDDRILEIGCGPGVAAGLVCERLRGGRLLAIDRSAVATRRTAERNAAAVAAGLLEVRTVGLHELVVPAASLDAAFAIDVNLFWTAAPTRELDVLTAALRPGGALHVCYGAGGPQPAERITAAVAGELTRHGFVGVDVRVDSEGLAVSGLTP
jgi:SAM-dependent methyltransferase